MIPVFVLLCFLFSCEIVPSCVTSSFSVPPSMNCILLKPFRLLLCFGLFLVWSAWTLIFLFVILLWVKKACLKFLNPTSCVLSAFRSSPSSINWNTIIIYREVLIQPMVLRPCYVCMFMIHVFFAPVCCAELLVR